MAALFSLLDGGLRYEAPLITVVEMEVGQVLCESGDGAKTDDLDVKNDWIIG